MSYVALYRKFRPASFDEVKGQDAIVTTLRNQVRKGRTQHAYLFCGTRGTGKTTIAKIMAKAVNCEHPVDGNPCGECAMCRSIAAGTSLNVIEIDAASNNGVDNVRDIIEEVQYRPAQGKYKVYIIDEVHMLSGGAFNALLKTLEEPPSYVIFILATTEFSKIPLTILSRCQRYDFHRIESTTIADRLHELCERENQQAEDKALSYIARQADGSMRDALSLLDQCLAFNQDGLLTYEKVLDVLGAADTAVFAALLKALVSGDTSGAINELENMLENGREVGQFTADFIWYLRNMLLVKATPVGIEPPVDVSEEQMNELRLLSDEVDERTLMRYIRILSDLTNQMRYASNRRVLAEMAMIKLAHPQMETTPEALIERIRVLESKIEKLEKYGVRAAAVKSDDSSEMLPEPEEEEPEEEVVPAAPEDLQQIVKEWSYILRDLGKDYHMDVQMIQRFGKLKFDPANASSILFVELSDNLAHRSAESEDLKKAIQSAIARRYGKGVEVVLCIKKPKDNTLKNITVDEQLKRINMPVEIE